MKVLLFLLSFGILPACRSEIMEQPNEYIVEQPSIINLVKKNDLVSVQAALEKGASVNTQDGNGRSLLLIATMNQQADMAQLLVRRGADVNLQADNQDSPFLYAGASGQTELVKLFLANGARFDVFNRYNGTALIPACERGHVETAQLLVSTKGFPVNHINRLGWTALLEAVILGDGGKRHQEIVRILKKGGADIGIADKDGITPLQHARSRGFKEIVQILES